MKSLTKKPKKDRRDQINKKKSPPTQTPTQDSAQCCAKVSKTIAGCHD